MTALTEEVASRIIDRKWRTEIFRLALLQSLPTCSMWPVMTLRITTPADAAYPHRLNRPVGNWRELFCQPITRSQS